MRPLPKPVVAKLRTKGVQPSRRAPGPSIDEWEEIRICQLCGEENVRIIESGALPDDLEGSACERCVAYHEEELESHQQAELDRADMLREEAFMAEEGW
jgi:hypothetical protein